MKKVVIVHGWEGYPEGEWRPWLREKLTEKGYQVDIPEMPNTVHPTMKEWVGHLKEIVGTPNEETILVGHSLGVITILRYLEGLKDGEQIGAAILVSGFSQDLEYENYKGELSSFFPTPVNFEKIKKHCNKFAVLHSKEDKWVDVRHAYIFQEKLNAEITIQEGMGHYSEEDGVKELPILLELIEATNSET